MTTTAKRERMTDGEARSFGRYSVGNAAMAVDTLVRSGACTGTCEPYRDMFTFPRWLAQGFAVRKGQHGARLSTFIEREQEQADGTVRTVKQMWMTTVFCRHQVDRAKVRR